MISAAPPTLPCSVRVAEPQDVRQMTEILFDGLVPTKYFEVVYPDIDREHWIDVLADYCMQHVDDPNSVAFVTKAEDGSVTGMAYGGFLARDVPQARRKPLRGTNQAEHNKMDNGVFKERLITKYGRFLWMEMFAVAPQCHGQGLGKSLLHAFVEEGKKRRVNVGLSGVEEAVPFYKKFGFVQLTPPRMIAGGIVPGHSTRSPLRVAREADLSPMTKVLYEGLSTTEFFPVVWPKIQKENWISVQADYCAQHIDQPDSVTFVTQDGSDVITGMAYGRFIPEAGTPKGDPIIGTDELENRKLVNVTTQAMLTEKYGGIFWLGMIAVSPQHQGKGYGQALLTAIITEAKQCGRNIALSSAEEASWFYEKHGFKGISPPVMLGPGKVLSGRKMLLELFPAARRYADQT